MADLLRDHKLVVPYLLESPLSVYRIADARHPILSGQGAAMYPGRWNEAGDEAIYGCLTYEGAMLEKLAQVLTTKAIGNQQVTEISIPVGTTASRFENDLIMEWWNKPDETAAFGHQWLTKGETVVLLVPGVLARPYQWNAILNPNHPDFKRIASTTPAPVIWDSRLLP